MNIWIVDDDIFFAATLKESILSRSRYGRCRIKVMLHYSAEDFVEALGNAGKDRSKQPDLIFLDVNLPGKDGLSTYLDMVEKDDPVRHAVIFCSSVGFGRFENYFLERGMSVPPFVGKSRIDSELDSILSACMPEEPEKKGFASDMPLPLARQAAFRLKNHLDRMREIYYSAGFEDKSGRFLSELYGFEKESVSLDLNDLARKAAYLIELLEQKRPAGTMRIKKEMRDLFRMADKVMGNL